MEHSNHALNYCHLIPAIKPSEQRPTIGSDLQSSVGCNNRCNNVAIDLTCIVQKAPTTSFIICLPLCHHYHQRYNSCRSSTISDHPPPPNPIHTTSPFIAFTNSIQSMITPTIRYFIVAAPSPGTIQYKR